MSWSLIGGITGSNDIWRRTWNVWTIFLLWAGDIGFNAPRKVGPQGTRGEAGVTWQKMGDIMGMFLETKAICSALQPSCPVIDWGFTLSARSFVLVIQISTKLRCNLRSKSLRWSDTPKNAPWISMSSDPILCILPLCSFCTFAP